MAFVLTDEKKRELTSTGGLDGVAEVQARVRTDQDGETALYFDVQLQPGVAEGESSAAIGQTLQSIARELRRRAASIPIFSYVKFVRTGAAGAAR